MNAVLERLNYLISVITGILGLLGIIHQTGSKELVPYSTELNAEQANSQLSDPTVGVIALKSALNTANAGIVAVQSDVAAVNSAVALVPPAVWYQTNQFAIAQGYGPVSNDELLAYAAALAYASAGSFSFRVAGSPWFVLEPTSALWLDFTATALSVAPPTPDWSDIRPSDTTYSWLNRTDTTYSWTLDVVANSPFTVIPGGPHSRVLRCILTRAELLALAGFSATPSAPVWPGIAGVTLGGSLPLAANMDVAGPMAGILVDLTSLPSGQTLYVVGTADMPYAWGHLLFEQDNGQCEPFQYLSSAHAMYLPRQMAAAAVAHIRFKGGPTGSVTPFTIP